MAIYPIVFFGGQLGKEITPGTSVAADKQLLSLGFSRLMPKAQGGMIFRGQGNKLGTLAVPPGKQWSEIAFQGPITYNESVYAFVSAIKSVTPTSDGTNGKKWVFNYALNAADAKQTFTYENGNSSRAQKATYAHISALKLEMSKEITQISGTMLAQKRQDGITITPTPTQISPSIVAPLKFDVYIASSQAGLAGASVFPLPLKVTLDVPKISDVIFRMNSTEQSFFSSVEQAIEPKLTLGCGSDSADYANFLALIDSGATQWIRVKALGAVIAGAIPSQELFQLDFCGNLIQPESRNEEAGAATNEFTFEGTYDSTAGFEFQVTETNTLAAI